MIKNHVINDDLVIAELIDNSYVINNSQDALDLMTMAECPGCNKYIIYEKNLARHFFNLSSGLAGEILQKFSNYGIRLAIIGDFSKYKSKNLNDFFRESNKRGHILFLNAAEEAIDRFKK